MLIAGTLKNMRGNVKSVYVGGSMAALEECEQRARALEARGWRVTSTWHRRSESGQSYAQIAERDLVELVVAGHVTICGDTPSSSGGWHTELGLAVSLGKHVTVIGEHGARNVFSHLPGVQRFPTWSAYLDSLDDSDRTVWLVTESGRQ
jgi:hypothetical protein